MLTKLCLPVFFLSWVVFGSRAWDNGFGGSEIDYPLNSPRFPMDMDLNEEDRIYGGQEAAVGQFPHQVAPRVVNAGYSCGGSILSERFILTAAHCVHGKAIERWDLVVGALGRHSDNGTFYKVERSMVHEDFVPENGSDRILNNDIALIRTATPIQFNDLVRPIRLHPGFIGIAEAVVSGWGLSNDVILNLEYLNVTTVTNDECRRALKAKRPNMPPPVYDNQTICAFSGRKQHGVCKGDSGSPLTVDNQLIGITSWAYACADGVPDGYTRISTFIDWINTNMQKFQDI